MLYLDDSTNTILVARHTDASATSIVFYSTTTNTKKTLRSEDFILTSSEYYYTFKLLDNLGDLEVGTYNYSVMSGDKVIETGVAIYSASSTSNEVSYETEITITQYNQ